MLGREAEGDGHVEIGRAPPSAGRTSRARSAESCPPSESPVRRYVTPSSLHPAHGVVQPVVLEMEPLADAQFRGESRELVERRLGRAVLAQQPHVEMAVVGRALPPPCGGSSRPRIAADRKGCTNGSAACARSAVPRSAPGPRPAPPPRRRWRRRPRSPRSADQ